MKWISFVVLLVMVSLITGCRRPVSESETEGQVAVSADHPMPPQPLRPSYARVEIRETATGVRNVFYRDQNVTQFTNPHHIYSAEVSPSGNYLLVWHMDYTPRKVSVYELPSLERVAHFEPGAGGQLQWGDYDLLYHAFGAGTNAAPFYVYNVAGETLWGGCPTGRRLDASGRYVIIFPSLSAAIGPEEAIEVLDIRNGAVCGRADKPSDFGGALAYTWLDGRTIRVWYDATEDENYIGHRTIDIPVDLDHPVEPATPPMPERR
jgi:hypothetical protein